MTALIALAAIAAAFTALFYMARKAGVDKAENAANKEALKDVVKANAPATADDIKRVQSLFRRD